MPRPVRASIDLTALRHNLAVARRAAGTAGVLAVVKADAYGHGLKRVLPALEAADGLALVELDKAIWLREGGYRKRLLLLGGFFEASEVALFARHGLTAVIHDGEQLRMLESADVSAPIDVFLKINTGMNRLGFDRVEVEWVIRRHRASGKLGALTLMTHFANADDSRGVDWQAAVLDQAGIADGLPRSLANSAALLRYPASRGDWVRPGIMLYGSSPFPEVTAEALALEPVMTLETKVVAQQRLRPGDRVGYGGTFVASAPMRIGVIACGYGDGYSRHAPSGTPVLIDGRRSSTVGLVSMDLICVDLTALPESGVGSRVVLWGPGLSVDEVARASGTVSYELLCALNRRVAVVTLDTDSKT